MTTNEKYPRTLAYGSLGPLSYTMEALAPNHTTINYKQLDASGVPRHRKLEDLDIESVRKLCQHFAASAAHAQLHAGR